MPARHNPHPRLRARRSEPRPPTPLAVRYVPPHAGVRRIETMSLEQLCERGSAEHLAMPQRLEMLLFMLYLGGRGEHVIDFVAHPVRADSLIVVPPGSVHQFRLRPGMRARLLVVDPVALQPVRAGHPAATDATAWPPLTRLEPAMRERLLALCREIEADTTLTASGELLDDLARARLASWVALLRTVWERERTRAAAALPGPAQLINDFRSLLERHVHQRWSALDYARKLGVAPRTLARACRAISGRSAKRLIDERVLLEAQRLLADGRDNVQAVAWRLGFESSSQLVQFFKRLAGTTPAAFRASLLGGR